MKKTLLIILMGCTPLLFGQNLSDSFDTYTSGNMLASQSAGLWTTWSNTPGSAEDAEISMDYAYSEPNSVKLETGGSTDVILPLGNQTSGKWNMSFMILIPSDNGAYFNMLHDFNGNNSNWAFDVFFSETGEGTVNIGGATSTNTLSFTFDHDKWFLVSLDINVFEGTIEGTIDGGNLSWDWTIGSQSESSTIGALNLYAYAPNDETGLYYIDDVSFTQTDLAIEELDVTVKVYPNPVSHQLIIDTENIEGASCEIHSILGSQICTKTLISNREYIDCSNWSPGIYFIQITSQFGTVKRMKFIVE